LDKGAAPLSQPCARDTPAAADAMRRISPGPWAGFNTREAAPKAAPSITQGMNH